MRKDFTVFLISLILGTTLNAQLCDGNLGENIFAQGDFGNGLDNVLQTDPQIAPGYIYEPNPSPFDGFYTITNNTGAWSFLFPTWIATGDNSNDPRGYMMIVNASNEPGLFYEEQVIDLCENTVYQFSADIINLVRSNVTDHIFPNVSFLLDDVEQFSTGNILQTERWQKYGFTFKTDPGQTEVKLSLRNNAPGGGGNDLALDNISFQACGSNAFLNADNTIFLCENDNTPVRLDADIEQANQAISWQISFDSITWNDIPDIKDEFLIHDNFSVGSYYYRYLTAGTETELQNSKCRILSDVLLVDVLPLNYQVSVTICEGEIYDFGDLDLNASGDYFNSFISSRGCDSLVDLNLTVLEFEDYTININLTDPNCFESEDGSISGALANSQRAPYSFTLNEIESAVLEFNNLAAGNYTLTIEDSFGCTQTADYILNEQDELIVSLPEDTIVDLGDALEIELIANQNLSSVTWLPSTFNLCDDCEMFTYQPPYSHTLVVQVTNEAGCEGSDEMIVNVEINEINIYIPNIISEHVSGNSDFTIGATEGLIKLVNAFRVYDRWGNIIYEIEDTEDLSLWKNPRSAQGLYTYQLELLLLDDQVYKFYGDILLLK